MGGQVSGESAWRRVRVVNVGSVPSAGADWLVTVPAGKVWRVLSAYAQLVSSAVAGQRSPRLQVGDGVATFLDLPPVNGQGSGITHRYAWGPALSAMQPIAGVATTLQAAAVSTAATGVALSYTCPASNQAFVASASFFLIGGTAPTVALQLVRGATVTTLWSGSASTFQNTDVTLLPGDVIRWNVTAGGATSTADFTISVEPTPQSSLTTSEVIPIPELVLGPAWTIGTSTDGIQAADQWTAPRIYVVETTVQRGPLDLYGIPDFAVQLVSPGPE